MFKDFLISKKEIANIKITPKNPLALTCEKITQSPRTVNTAQVKSATENITLIDIEEIILPDLVLHTIEFVLKDFFLYMHQTGLYNRQFKLWKALGNVTQASVFQLQKGLFSKKDLNAKIVHFYIAPNSPCVSIVIDENEHQQNFEIYSAQILKKGSISRLRGILYFFSGNPRPEFIKKLHLITHADGPILKYESILVEHEDIRLDAISYCESTDKYKFSPVYPELRASKKEILQS